ncbi:MAG: class I SAM-dependent methyltransferase [Chloroflexi bacterium]|nr:class I SAM-dependent methyltransferase [Chloroflexota bacterium]
MNVSAMFWNMLANNFDEQEGQYQQLQIKVAESAKKYLNVSDLVLDYGCATGAKAFELADQVKEIYGIDISSKMIAAAQRKAVERKVQNIDFAQATIFDTRLKKESFDVVLAFGILHLLKDPPKVIQRINELLKSGGWFVSSTACMGDDQTIPTLINRILFIPSRIGVFPHVRFLKIPELEQAITRGKFQIVETETLAFDPTNDQNFIVGHFVAAKKV